ncbi:hypothetical protein EUTSA_v10007507mg [Eutrema salsugineum]|uniref:Cytochrome P450 n=1 Tax=Eutrema salsugineum TaxID=72664 RepID=V4KW02_EUTSA|nr:hypothetical protein EUTSA_v10007507mg [Eutrema salsugineum]
MSVFLCLFFLLPLILILLKNLRPSKWNLPPGPPKLPIIGNLHQRRELHPRNRRNLSQKYGPVVLLRFGFVPVVVISSKEAAEEVLKIHDHEYCSRPETVGTRKISYNGKGIGFAPYGEEWKAMRKLSVVELFSMKKLQSFRYIREEENDLFVKKLSESASRRSLVNLKKTLFTLVASIVCRIGFGLNLHKCEFIDEVSIADFVHKCESVTRTSMFSDFFPGRTGQNKRLENTFSEVDSFLQNILDDHLKPGRRVQESSDIIDVMIEMMRKQDNDGDSFKPTTDNLKGMISGLLMVGEVLPFIYDQKLIIKNPKKVFLTNARIYLSVHIAALFYTAYESVDIRMVKNLVTRSILYQDIFIAGVNTSAYTMIWAMTELIRNPRVMKKVQDEIRTTLGNKKERITEQDLTKLHYFKLMVKETLRLHPAAPLLLPRETLSHIKIQGYDIPAKTKILINAYAIARDPKIWTNSDEFNPTGFLTVA